jgi:glycosyltransferase involved in cell wall biosynthesis
LNELRPDCVVSFTDVTNILALLANLRRRRPIVVSERSDPVRHPLDRVTIALRASLYGTADSLVVQNRESLKWAQSLRFRPATYVIPNAIVPFVAGEVDEGAVHDSVPYVLAVGRLGPEKGFDLLIRAFARVRERHSDIRLVILGEGPMRTELERLVRELQLTDVVTMPGRRDARPWFAAARAFVLSSRYEGFPNALGEAMSAGVPVVATRCPSGPEEMVVHGESGLLVDVGSIDALAAAILEVLDDPERARRFGQSAQVRARESFSPEKIWDQWERVFQAAVARQRCRRLGGFLS